MKMTSCDTSELFKICAGPCVTIVMRHLRFVTDAKYAKAQGFWKTKDQGIHVKEPAPEILKEPIRKLLKKIKILRANDTKGPPSKNQC